MRVSIEFVKWLAEQRNKINSVTLSKIEWYEHGKPANLDQSIMEDFEIIGLNNTDFITSGFYRKGWDSKN